MKVLLIITTDGDEHHLPLEPVANTAAFMPNFPDAKSVELLDMTEAEYFAIPVHEQADYRFQ